MHRLVFILAASICAPLSASAFMGDSLAQTLVSYGQPVAATGQAGQSASTRTFSASGLQILCGYLNGKVAMETLTNPQRDFLPAEVEALLRNEAENQNWTLPGGGTTAFVQGTYKRADGVTAKVIGNKIEIISPAWTAALAKDQAAPHSPNGASAISTNTP